MRDLVKLSEAELGEISGRQGLRLVTAIALALTSGGLALAGMMARFSPGDETLLPGMDQFGGQLAWSALLGTMLVLAAWLVRGAIARRLQGAIAISLLIHLLLCLTLQVLHVGVPFNEAVHANDTPGRPLEELSLPDYGGMEAPVAEAAWQRPAETATRQRELEPDRQKTEANDPSQPQPMKVEHQQEVAKSEVVPREEQMKLEKEARAELERQMRDQPTPSPEAVAEPKVNVAKSAPTEAEARVEQARQSNAATMSDRVQQEIASSDPRLKAATLKAQRTESKPQAANQQVQLNERAAAQAQAAAATAAESGKVMTSAASQAEAQEQSVEAQRQQSPGMSAERPAVKSPASASTTKVASVRPDRAAGIGNPSSAAPTSGGAANLTRNHAKAGAATDAGAESVNVASAGGVGAPRMAESAAAGTATRGQAATVPLGIAGSSGSTAPNASSAGAPVRGTGSIARQSTETGQPQLGQASPNPVAGGGTGKPAKAVGTQAGEVAVSSAGTNAASQEKGVLVGGPAGTAINRQSSGLPGRASGTGSDPASSTGPSGPTSTGSAVGSATGSPNSVRGTAGRGLAARTTEPNAHLGTKAGFAPDSVPGLSTGRTGADVALPSGATTAEQSGTLVFAGPQTQATAGGRLAGPQSSSVPRRSAGLPGSNGNPATIGAPLGLGDAQPSRMVGGPVRSGVGDDRPKLAAAEQIAGLFKQSVPGIGASPEAKISASLAMRKPESRREATKTLGGSDASEEAVERGLQWLAQHQHPDGHWSIHEFACRDHECTGHGSFHSDSAATGLALLAFLGAGYTHQAGQHQAVVERGLKWHLQHQKPDGDLFADESEFVWFYSHGMASIALCEAYGLTRDADLKEPAQKAIDFIVKSQHPEFGGWRYRPRFETDTSVSGWQLMALKSGEMAGLTVPKSAYSGVATWLDSVESKSAPGQFAYHPSKSVSLAMTAEGLLMRQYLGAKRDDPRLISGADYLRKHLPDLGERDAYFWYYATQVMFHMQGEYWDEWNARLRDTLISTQLKDGGANGSWNSDRPSPEKWGTAGGRHYVTCLNLLMLEVYYRHLPLYIELGK